MKSIVLMICTGCARKCCSRSGQCPCLISSVRTPDPIRMIPPSNGRLKQNAFFPPAGTQSHHALLHPTPAQIPYYRQQDRTGRFSVYIVYVCNNRNSIFPDNVNYGSIMPPTLQPVLWLDETKASNPESVKIRRKSLFSQILPA